MVFENTISGVEHVALIKGDISTPDPVLVRMHSLNMMTDLLGEVSERRDGHELETAMQTISEQGAVLWCFFANHPRPACRRR